MATASGSRGKISFLAARAHIRWRKTLRDPPHNSEPEFDLACARARQCRKNLSPYRHSFRRHRRRRGLRFWLGFPAPSASTRRPMRRMRGRRRRDRHRRRTRPSLSRGRDARDRRARPPIRLFARLRLSNRCATMTPRYASLPSPACTHTLPFAARYDRFFLGRRRTDGRAAAANGTTLQIPDEVVVYLLQKAGCNCTDVRL